MGNVCGGTKSLNDHPTHHRLGSVSDTPRPPAQGSNGTPTQVPVTKPKPVKSSRPPVDAGGADERARRAQAAEERAKAAAARGTVASNPKQGQLASKIGKPVERTADRQDEEPLRWD